MKRLLWVDNLKAFVIFLVVIGHVIPWVMGDMAPQVIINYLGMFDMPLFMAISGYCSYKEFVTFDKVKRRFLQLVIPFFFWPLVWYLIKMDFSGIADYYMHLPLNPDTGLWFLYVLFLIFMLDFCRHKLLRHVDVSQLGGGKRRLAIYAYEYSVIGTIILLFFAYWAYKRVDLPGNWISFVALYYPCYVLGCILRRHNSWLIRNLKWLGAIGIVVFLPAAYFLEGIIWRIPIGACGTFAAFFLFSKYLNFKTSQLVMFTGISTLGIYAVHQPVIHYVKHIITTPLWADVILTFVITYAISIVAVWLLKMPKITRFLLLGMNE